MNAYTTRCQARIQPHDLAAVLRAHGHTAGAALAAFERQRGFRAEAEVDWLLKPDGVTPQARASRVALVQQTIGAALARAGEWLAGVPRAGDSPETAAATCRGTVGGL